MPSQFLLGASWTGPEYGQMPALLYVYKQEVIDIITECSD